jgi:hypothetical protein
LLTVPSPMPLAPSSASSSLPSESSSALLTAHSSDTSSPDARVSGSCAHIRYSHSPKPARWKLQSTYVRGQCERALAQSTAMCRIAAGANVESWNSTDGRADDFAFLRKSSHKAMSQRSKKLESSLDDEPSPESPTRSTVPLADKYESPVPSSETTWSSLAPSLDSLTWAALVQDGRKQVASDDCWLSDDFSDMPTRSTSSASSMALSPRSLPSLSEAADPVSQSGTVPKSSGGALRLMLMVLAASS